MKIFKNILEKKRNLLHPRNLIHQFKPWLKLGPKESFPLEKMIEKLE